MAASVMIMVRTTVKIEAKIIFMSYNSLPHAQCCPRCAKKNSERTRRIPAPQTHLSRNCNRLARIIDNLIHLRRWFDSHAVTLSDKYNSKCTVSEHSRELSMAITNN